MIPHDAGEELQVGVVAQRFLLKFSGGRKTGFPVAFKLFQYLAFSNAIELIVYERE
jgi:hypothetical protein